LLERVSELGDFFRDAAISFIADSAMCCCANALQSPCLKHNLTKYKKNIKKYKKVQPFYHQLDGLHPQEWLYFNDPRNQFPMFGEGILTAFRSTDEGIRRDSPITRFDKRI
jgi:hypothetical protein